MTTTRETADHAELARLAEAAYDAIVTPGEQAHRRRTAFIAAAGPATILSLLSEIAALRGELKSIEINHDIWVEIAEERQNHATQAERQRDELRKALEPFASLLPDGLFNDDDDVECVVPAEQIRSARTLLDNHGADQ